MIKKAREEKALKLSANVKKKNSNSRVFTFKQPQPQFKCKSSSRKDRPSFHSEIDAYGIDVAPFSLFESQVIPVYIHNLYKLIFDKFKYANIYTKTVPK